MNRLELPMEPEQPHEEGTLLQWQTYEVFQQQKRGQHHVHVGSLHAPNEEMALVLAKEQFGRREQCANLWVVKSQNVHATSYEDADMFLHAFDKSYRESDGYRVKDTIEIFQRELDARLLQHNKAEAPATETAVVAVEAPDAYEKNCEVVQLKDLGKGQRKILIKR